MTIKGETRSDHPQEMYCFTTLFKNTRILKFKSRQSFMFFDAVNHLSGPLREQKFTYNIIDRSKKHICEGSL